MGKFLAAGGRGPMVLRLSGIFSRFEGHLSGQFFANRLLRGICRQRKSLAQWLLGSALWISFAGIVVTTLWSPTYDWDMDTFLYLAENLRRGKLLYLDDFDVKLPLIPYLFLLPVELSGINTWRLITSILVALSSYILSWAILANLLKRVTHNQVLVVSGASLVAIYALPGAESAHISMVAAAFFSMAMALLLLPEIIQGTNMRLFLVGFLLSLSILTRPNFAFVAIALSVLGLRRALRGVAQVRFRGATYVVLGFVTPVALCIFPYVTREGGLSAFWNGVLAISDFSEGRSLTFLLLKQFVNRDTVWAYSAIWVAALLGLFWIITNISKSPIIFDLVAVQILLLVGLNISFMLSHFHDHYIQLFLPSVILVFASLAFVLEVSADGAKRYVALGIGCLLFVAPLTNFWVSIADSNSQLSQIHSYQSRSDQNLAFLAGLQAAQYSFWVSDSPYYHWKLQESRIGDGHPAIARSILSNSEFAWNLPVFAHLDLVGGPCNFLENSGKDFLIIGGIEDEINELAVSCLSAKGSSYCKIGETPSGKLWVAPGPFFREIYAARTLEIAASC